MCSHVLMSKEVHMLYMYNMYMYMYMCMYMPM